MTKICSNVFSALQRQQKYRDLKFRCNWRNVSQKERKNCRPLENYFSRILICSTVKLLKLAYMTISFLGKKSCIEEYLSKSSPMPSCPDHFFLFMIMKNKFISFFCGHFVLWVFRFVGFPFMAIVFSLFFTRRKWKLSKFVIIKKTR